MHNSFIHAYVNKGLEHSAMTSLRRPLLLLFIPQLIMSRPSLIRATVGWSGSNSHVVDKQMANPHSASNTHSSHPELVSRPPVTHLDLESGSREVDKDKEETWEPSRTQVICLMLPYSLFVRT